MAFWEYPRRLYVGFANKYCTLGMEKIDRDSEQTGL
jgi:hypothetical protein